MKFSIYTLNNNGSGMKYHTNDDSEELSSDLLDYIAEHNSDPTDFLYAIMHEANLSDKSALDLLTESFGYKYSEQELKQIIEKYHKEEEK